ncbi:MAG: DUF58 domain-containing protein [Rhodocyclaceae bacterium]|nr:DUF58 domain-containing protein [Rhodocyclaceae bacterium]
MIAAIRRRAAEAFARWGLRGRPPEPVPIVLDQRRIFVLPTRTGLAFGLSLAVMLIGAINYGLSLGYVLVFLLAGLGISSILQTFRNLSRLSISPGRAEPVFAGDTAQFTLLIADTRDEPRPQLRVLLPDGDGVTVDVGPRGTAEAVLRLPAPRRGWLALPRCTLETVYPLGFVRAWAYAAPDFRCLVYPAPASRPPPMPGGGDGAGHAHQGARGTDDFAGLRGHQPADSPRHVAWKVVARRDDGHLVTKLFTGEEAESLWFDWESLPGVDTETRLSILTRWVCDARDAHLRWGLRLPGIEFMPDSGSGHAVRCLEALALYGLAPATASARAAKSDRSL